MTLDTPKSPATTTPRERADSTGPALLMSIPAPARRFAGAAWERRRTVGLFVFVVTVLAAATTFVLPKWYVAESTILPPADGEQGLGLVTSLIENTALSKLGLVSSTTPSDIYVEILKSRTLREALVRDFDLQRLYRQKGMDFTLMELDAHVKITIAPVGIVTVRVEDQDPKRAAEMANHLVRSLDRFNSESVNTRAKRTRQFLEERLKEVQARMHEAESTLAAYERKHSVVASGDAALVGPVADVIAQKMALEIRRSYLSSYTRPGSPLLREMDTEIAAMEREFAKLPALKQQGSRLVLDAGIQRRIFTLLTTQHEEMRVQEMRDTPTLTVLDVARPPEHRARPRRSLIVVVSALVATLMGMVWVGLSMRGPIRT